MRYKEELINQEYDESEYEIDLKTLIIHVNGELDHHNAVAIRKMADKKIYDNGIRNILFDFDFIQQAASQSDSVTLCPRRN